MTDNEKAEEEYRAFQDRLNLPGCAQDLTDEELEDLKSKGLI